MSAREYRGAKQLLELEWCNELSSLRFQEKSLANKKVNEFYYIT